MSASVTPIQEAPQPQRLRITEIFSSIQGESTLIGLPTTFIRLTGCPLRCNYCDTTYAFNGGEWMVFDKIYSKVKNFQHKHITVTGGEPLAQKNCLALLTNLCDQGYKVSLETSGAIDVKSVDPRVIKVMDIKTPSSQECEKTVWDNVNYLREHDQVKFVIASQDDYAWAKNVLLDKKLDDRCEVLFSPANSVENYQGLEPTQLADWILQDKLEVRFQLQLHKFLWGNAPGR